MASTSDIRNGLCIRYNHDIYKIIEFLHVKPGKGPAFVRTKLKSVTTGKVLDNTFSAGHKIEDIRVETHKFQFLYEDGEFWHFMATDGSFEQVAADEKAVSDASNWLKEQVVYQVTLFNGAPIAVTAPNFVELEVTETDPGVRGDTSGAGPSQPSWSPVQWSRCRCSSTWVMCSRSIPVVVTMWVALDGQPSVRVVRRGGMLTRTGAWPRFLLVGDW